MLPYFEEIYFCSLKTTYWFCETGLIVCITEMGSITDAFFQTCCILRVALRHFRQKWALDLLSAAVNSQQSMSKLMMNKRFYLFTLSCIPLDTALCPGQADRWPEPRGYSVVGIIGHSKEWDVEEGSGLERAALRTKACSSTDRF